MDVHATLRFLRMSPRKVRLVVDSIRGLKATEAETRLQFMKRHAAKPVLKLLRSGMANAEHNFQLQRENLTVATITADGGPVLKRSRPRAMGRGAPIRKPTTHIKLILSTPSVLPVAKAEKVPEASEVKVQTVAKKTRTSTANRKTTGARSTKKAASSSNA